MEISIHTHAKRAGDGILFLWFGVLLGPYRVYSFVGD